MLLETGLTEMAAAGRGEETIPTENRTQPLSKVTEMTIMTLKHGLSSGQDATAKIRLALIISPPTPRKQYQSEAREPSMVIAHAEGNERKRRKRAPQNNHQDSSVLKPRRSARIAKREGRYAATAAPLGKARRATPTSKDLELEQAPTPPSSTESQGRKAQVAAGAATRESFFAVVEFHPR
jgi:hypothetical protein